MVILFVVTGCTAEYNVTINKDLTVSESIQVIGDDRFKLTNEYTVDSMYNALTNTYNEIYDIVKNNIINKTSIDNNLSVNGENTYASVKEFINSDYIKILYGDGLSMKTSGNVITLSTDNTVDNLWLFIEEMDEDSLISELNVNIKLPYLVTDNNADKVDDKNNIYTWEYDFNSYDKQILLEFDKSQSFKKGIGFLTILKYVVVIAIIGVVGYFGYKLLGGLSNKNNKI